MLFPCGPISSLESPAFGNPVHEAWERLREGNVEIGPSGSKLGLQCQLPINANDKCACARVYRSGRPDLGMCFVCILVCFVGEDSGPLHHLWNGGRWAATTLLRRHIYDYLTRLSAASRALRHLGSFLGAYDADANVF